MYSHPKILEVIGKMQPADLQDELRQELAVIICKLPDERLFDYYNRKVLLFHCIRSILNMAKSGKSTFWYTFRRFPSLMTELTNYNQQWEEPNEDMTPIYHTARKKMDELPAQERKAVETYLEHGTFISVQRKLQMAQLPAKKLVSNGIAKVKHSVKGASKIRATVEIELVLTCDETPDNIMDVLSDASGYIEQNLRNRTVSNYAYITNVKEARLK